MFTNRQLTIGVCVRLCGCIAEHYPAITGTVTDLSHSELGLAHLNKYRVRFSQGHEEWFYEFQLAASLAGNEQDCV